VGLGKLGASIAAAIASRGHCVIGVDRDAEVVARLAGGESPVEEPGLDVLISANRSRIHATQRMDTAIAGSDLTFVVVPTPSDERGAFSVDQVAAAFREIGEALAAKRQPHTVVLTSTVLPGATRYALLPVLERASGRRFGGELGLCYSPAFIALGSVVRDFLNPDFVLIGELDRSSGDRLEAAYAEILESGAPVRRMSLENAELTKLAVNTFVTTKVTFANMLAELCERIPGGDVDVVTDALGLDARIGRKYLTGALGYGGPCFPRDNQALGFLARAAGTRAPLAETTDAANRAIVGDVVRRVCAEAPPGATVAVLGLAYKPATPVIDEAPGVLLAEALARAGFRVLAHDPVARDAARARLDGNVTVLEAVDECLRPADVVLVTTPDPLYRALSAASFNGKPHPVVVFDFWRILREPLSRHANIRYVGAGLGRADEGARWLAELWSTI
jgi:UDPglucose 6-dehydrogenase